jgi:hypothetical protein
VKKGDKNAKVHREQRRQRFEEERKEKGYKKLREERLKKKMSKSLKNSIDTFIEGSNENQLYLESFEDTQ